MYEVTVFPLSDSHYVSYPWVGLYDLAVSGRISIRVSYWPRVDIREKNGAFCFPRNDHIFFFEVKDKASGEKRRVCIDLMDNWHISSLSGLYKSDVYFKRSYQSERIRETVPAEFARKVLPFGLFFGLSSDNERHHLARSIMTELATRVWLRHPKGAAGRILQCWSKHHGRTRKDKPLSMRKGIDRLSNQGTEFEVAPDVPDSRKILFLTRAFDPSRGWDGRPRDNVESLNIERADLIRAFRKYFGDRFVGGLIRNDYACEKFKDCLAEVSTVRSDYLRLVRECRIGMTTRGLVDSIPGKLAEYIAASRCILSDPLRYTLPFDIKHGEHAMFLGSLEQAIEHAERLLTDDDLAYNMRMNNYKLYQEHVRPSAAMWRCINSAMEAPGA